MSKASTDHIPHVRYAYRCLDCRADFEEHRKPYRRDHPSTCPKCGGDGERVLSMMASKVTIAIPTRFTDFSLSDVMPTGHVRDDGLADPMTDKKLVVPGFRADQ